MTGPPRVCGAAVWRCAGCDRAVGKGRVRAGLACPRCPGAEVAESTCRVPVGGGRLRCKDHGGSTVAARTGAAEREATAVAARQLAVAGWEPVDDPLEAFADLLGEVVAVKDALGVQVGELTCLAVEDVLGREDVPAMLAAYERALDRCGQLLAAAGRLKLDERVVRLRERQVSKVVDAISRTLAAPELGLAADVQASAKARIAEELAR